MLPALLVVLFIVGAIGAYALATTEGTRVGPHQFEHERSLRKLSDSHVLGQIFEIEPAQLVGLRVWLAVPTTPPESIITARLYAYEFKRDIASATLPTTALRSGAASVFRFTAIRADGWPAGKPLTVELRMSTHGVPADLPLVGLGSSNRYSNGLVVYDGHERPREDLAFAALYRGTRIDELLPVTQIATARPGIFGWPPLYALLVWSMLWAAGSLLMSLIRTLYNPPAIDTAPHTD